MQRDDAYRIVQRLAQQAWDTRTPLRDAARARRASTSTSTRSSTTRHYMRHVPEVLARLEVIPHRRPDLRRPRLSADLFHAIPAGIIDPFLYVENDGRRAATVSVLDADKVARARHRGARPGALGRDELLAAGRPPHAIEVEIALRACRGAGLIERARAARVPGRRRRPPARRRRRADASTTTRFVARRRRQDPVAARGHPARAAGRRRGDGRRRAS